MTWIFALFVFFASISITESACTIPLSPGVWKTSSRGTWTVNSNQTKISGFELTLDKSGPQLANMSCNATDSSGSILLKSSLTIILFGKVREIYMCIWFNKSDTSTDVFFFSISTYETEVNNDGTYERVTASTSSACGDNSTAAERTYVAIKSGREANATITCPSALKGTFSYNNYTKCNNTYLNVCSTPTPTELLFNYSLCAEKQMFSASGILNCVYSTTSNGYTYLTVYNNDTTVNKNTTYQFSCMVFSTSGNTVWASINPKECLNSSRQTPFRTDNPSGQIRTFTNFRDYFCYPTTTTPTTTTELTTYTTQETTNATTGTTNSTTDSITTIADSITTIADSSTSTNLTWLYIVIVIIIIAIIVAMIICVIWALSRKKRRDKQKKADQEKAEKQNKQDEVENEKCKNEKERKKQKQDAEQTQIVEEDRSSIDSGFVPGKKDEELLHKEDRKRVTDINEERDEENRKPDIYDISQLNETLTEQNELKCNEKANNAEIHNTLENIKNDENKTLNDDQSADIKTNESSKIEIKQNLSVLEENHTSNDKNTPQSSEDKNKINNEEIESRDQENLGLNDNKRLDETDNETTNHDDDIVPKKNKHKRSVKIYENSDWNDHEDQQRKHRETGDNGTEQNNKIIDVQEKEELEKNDEQTEQDGQSEGEHKEGDLKSEDKQNDREGSPLPGEKEQQRRGSTLGPEEIKRNIYSIGMKTSRKYLPAGDLSKVLVSRKMEEENRKNAEQGTWGKMKNLFRVKTKKIRDISQTKEGQKGSATDSGELNKTGKKETPFMKEYLYKKQMEEQLYEQHVLEWEPEFANRLKDSDDEDFPDIFDDNNKLKDGKDKDLHQINVEQMNAENKQLETENKHKDLHQIHQINVEQMNAENKRLETEKHKQHKEELTIDNTTKEAEYTEEQAKDSGVDSPDIKKEKTDPQITSNDEMDYINEEDEIIISEPPPGFFRDSSGRIIRKHDKKVMTEKEMQSIFPLAKLRMLFHVPRLKRTSSGRPTGDYIIDDFGPKLNIDTESKKNGEIRDEHSKPKHPRSSRSGRKEQRDNTQQKTVAFEMDDRQSDIFIIEDEDALSRRDEISHRELLRKRLFRNKRKSRLRNGDQMSSLEEGLPRELSDLVRVIPQSVQKTSINGRIPIPGTVISRNDSMRNRFDPEQHLMYREGLAVDKKILEKSELNKHRPLGMPREAFIEHDPAENGVSMDNEEFENGNNTDGVNIGNEDEFVLVGNNKEPKERLFTYVRRPGQTTPTMVRPLQGSQESFHHDMRHSIPWSIINQYQMRDSSVLNANSLTNKHLAPKSADNAKREIDDRRLRELLEELYKDKKYFDHVINTTEPNSEPIIDERVLAEHGREFLLERAEYWDEKGVAIPRPPQTALGLRLSRMQMAGDSGRVSNISYASTVTPPPPPEHLSNRNKTSQAFQTRENTIV